MIDCDVHVQIGDVEQFLGYVEPGQRDWFRAQGPMLGLPGYPWAHPDTWFRTDLHPTPERPPGSTIEDVRRDVLDPHGVDLAFLNADDGVAVSLMASSYRAAAFARAHNDWLAECWLEADPRVRGSLLVPAQDPAAAVAEIERLGADQRFVQVLLPGGAERPYGDPRYRSIFEAAAAHDLRVAIHTGAEGMGIAASPGGAGPPSFYIEWHTLGSACSQMAHLVSLVCHGVLDQLPSLRIVLMEGGVGWLPGILWRLDTNWRGLRSEIPWLTRRPSEAVRDQVRFTTQPLEHTDGSDELLWSTLAAVGAPEILLYASDYPHWDFDDPGRTVARLPDAWREGVMHDNAAALYAPRLGLDAPADGPGGRIDRRPGLPA